MIDIPLATEANQSFTIVLEGQVWEVTLKEANGTMACTVVRDNVVIIQNTRVLPYAPIIPYPYLELGNLVITTENDELPYWTAFNVTQYLVYLTPAEMAEARA